MDAISYEMNKALNFERCNANVSKAMAIEAIIAELFDGFEGGSENWDGTLDYFCEEERECAEHWMAHFDVSLAELQKYIRRV